MKKIKINKYIALIFLCIGIVEGYTQGSIQPLSSNYPDTLILKTGTNNEVVFSFNRMGRKKAYLTDDLWKSTVNIMETAVINTDLEGGLVVTYRKDEKDDSEVAKVEVSRLERPNDIYVIGGEEVFQKNADRIEFLLYYDQLLISFSVNELHELGEIKALDIESVWSQIEMKFKDQGRRNLYSGTGEIKYGKANIRSIEGDNHGLDNIEFSAGVGLGFIRDRFVPDLNFKLGFNIADRLGNNSLQFGLLYTQHVFFEEEQTEGRSYTWDSNGFISGFFSHKFLTDYELGLAFGVLAIRNGDYFKEGTYKFSFYTSTGDDKLGMGISPEIIFTDNFKQAIPVIRIGFTF